MDRRRFVPSAEGLEVRQLLSTTKRTHAVPVNFAQKTLRIEHLPFSLHEVDPGRTIPHDLTTSIQADLTDIRGKLGLAKPATLNNFDLQVRHTLPNASINRQAARGLDVRFDQALESAGASPQQVANFQEDMDRLVAIDTHVLNPSEVVTNDYTIVLETALGVGRPIRTPVTPKLTTSERFDGDPFATRGVRQPQLVGTYDANTTLNLLDANANIIGTTTTGGAGHYTISPASLLSDGPHTFRIQAVDPGGDTSAASAPITIVIYPTNFRGHPRGPLAVAATKSP